MVAYVVVAGIQSVRHLVHRLSAFCPSTAKSPVGIRVHARMPTGGMPTSENCLVRAKCRPWLGGMPTGCNAEYSHYSHYSIL